MKRFHHNERVRIALPAHALNGAAGRVQRLRLGDNGAWVRMDRDLPDALRLFPADDPRRNHLLLYPGECEPER